MIKELLEKTSIGGLVLSYFIMFAIFLTAYFSESKSITIMINHFGEANFELFFFLLISVGLFIHLYNYYDYRMEKRKMTLNSDEENKNAN